MNFCSSFLQDFSLFSAVLIFERILVSEDSNPTLFFSIFLRIVHLLADARLIRQKPGFLKRW